MKKIKTRKEVIEPLHIYTDLQKILSGSLQEVANNILGLEKRLKNEHMMVIEAPNKYIRFNIGIEHGGFDGDPCELKLYGVRLESDVEFAKRINLERRDRLRIKKLKAENEKKELATFLRLKKKYAK